MPALTAHFTAEELSAASSAPVDAAKARAMAQLLESFRAAGGGFPLRVTSYHRSAARNISVGGVSSSQHLSGDAADVVPIGVAPNPSDNIRLWANNVLLAEARGELADYGQFIIYPGVGDHAHIGRVSAGNFREKLVKMSPEPGAKPEFGQLSLASVGIFGGAGVAVVLATVVVAAIAARGRS